MDSATSRSSTLIFPDRKCAYCSTRDNLLRCQPCGHDVVCVGCFGKAFNDSEQCPSCEAIVKSVQIFGSQQVEIMFPIGGNDAMIDCSICMETCAPTTFFPCLHNTFCLKCASRLHPNVCPLCRQTVLSIKEARGPIRNMREIYDRAIKQQVADLRDVVQVVIVGDIPPPALFQLQEHEEQRSCFWHNWECGEKRMRLTWYSSFEHISVDTISARVPDIVYLLRSDTSFRDLTLLSTARWKVRVMYQNIPKRLIGLGPRVLWMVCSEGGLYSSDDLSCRFVYLDLQFAIRCKHGCFKRTDMNDRDSVQKLFEWMWKEGKGVKEKNYSIKAFHQFDNTCNPRVDDSYNGVYRRPFLPFVDMLSRFQYEEQLDRL